MTKWVDRHLEAKHVVKQVGKTASAEDERQSTAAFEKSKHIFAVRTSIKEKGTKYLIS